jgi:hypothetical protein
MLFNAIALIEIAPQHPIQVPARGWHIRPALSNVWSGLKWSKRKGAEKNLSAFNRPTS